MTKERNLSKTEASLGLMLIAASLAVLGVAFDYRLHEETPATVAIPASAFQPPGEAPAASVTDQTSYQPQWLPSHGEGSPTLVR